MYIHSEYLYKRQVDITDKIKLYIPTVGEVLNNKDAYFTAITLLTATPYDMMVQLDDIGVDFSKISEYDLFLMLFRQLQTIDTTLVFGDMDFSKFGEYIDPETQEIAIINMEDEIMIDKATHKKIAQSIKDINFIDNKNKKPGNEEARKYMIERARKKQQRRLRRNRANTELEDLILAMVNCSEYRYDFDSTKELSIFQFKACVHQVIRRIEFDKIMIGVYAGTVNTKEISPDKLDWISQNK